VSNASPNRNPRFQNGFLALGGLLAAFALLAGCSGSGGSGLAGLYKPGTGILTPSPSPSPSPTNSVGTVTCTNTSTASIGATGGTISTNATTGSLTETFAAGAFGSATTVTLGYIAQANLPAPLARFRHLSRNGMRTPQFTAGAGNTYVAAFCTTFSGATPATAAALSGTGVVPNSIATGTQLNIAINQNGTWVDVGTALVTAGGNFQSTPATVSLPGVNAAGNYLVYLPASGTNTAQVNLGFALVADDGSGIVANGLQFIQIEDSSGNAEPTPTTTFFPLTGGDLDGQALTPDASEGAVVDGSNLVHFFSGIPQHNVVISPTTVDVTAYGGDGDSIVSLPSGDEAVVTGDNGGALAVISGILSGNPVIADTIPNPNTNGRDGLVISQDGTIMLSRGHSEGTPGIDVYSIAHVAPHAGSTATGTTSYNFTLSQTITTAATPFFEDGRDGMAISPTDPTRAVVIGYNSMVTPEVQLLTGLGSGSAAVNSLELRLPKARQHSTRSLVRQTEPSHREPAAILLGTDTEVIGVAITPDGTTAYVASNVGIVTVSGVNTGTLAQVGSLYSPSLPIGGSSCQLGAGTLGVTPDGKYLVVDANPVYSNGSCVLTAPASNDTNQGSGVLLTIPIGAGGVLGAPVGQLNYVVSPFNDQMIVH